MKRIFSGTARLGLKRRGPNKGWLLNFLKKQSDSSGIPGIAKQLQYHFQ